MKTARFRIWLSVLFWFALAGIAGAAPDLGALEVGHAPPTLRPEVGQASLPVHIRIRAKPAPLRDLRYRANNLKLCYMLPEYSQM
jgi:hypothetical protein